MTFNFTDTKISLSILYSIAIMDTTTDKETEAAWTISKSITLAEQLQDYPFIWDAGLPAHRSAFETQKAWESMAGLLGCSTGYLKKKYKSLRDYKKRQMKSTGSKSATSKQSELLTALSYLEASWQHRPTIGAGYVESSPATEASEEQQQSTPTPSTESGPDIDDLENASFGVGGGVKRKSSSGNSAILTQLMKRSTERDIIMKKLLTVEQDEMDQFFLSMSATVKKFPRRTQIEIKQQILNLVTDAEIQSMNSTYVYEYPLNQIEYLYEPTNIIMDESSGSGTKSSQMKIVPKQPTADESFNDQATIVSNGIQVLDSVVVNPGNQEDINNSILSNPK